MRGQIEKYGERTYRLLWFKDYARDGRRPLSPQRVCLAHAVLIHPLLVATALLLVAGQALGVTFDDGGYYVIDELGSFANEGVFVSNGSTVEMVDGGVALTVRADANGEVIVSGGVVKDSLEVDGIGATGTMLAGEVGGGLTVRSVASVSVSGGVIARGAYLDGSGFLSLSGGILGGDLSLWQSSGAEVSAGVVFGDLFLNEQSVLHMTGGGIVGALFLFDSTMATISGAEFNLPAGEVSSVVGEITGVLEDGTPLALAFFKTPSASLTLIAAPEPESSLLAAAALLALMWLRWANA